MIATDRTAWICDLAETYGVLNYKELPVDTLAALSVGLRDTSRIKMKLAGEKIASDIMLLAAAVDRLTFIAWTKTKAAERDEPSQVYIKRYAGRWIRKQCSRL